MVLKWLKSSALLAVGCAALLITQPARAVSVELKDNTGASSGLMYTVPDATFNATGVKIEFQRSSGNDFFFTKTATVPAANLTTPIIVTFDRVTSVTTPKNLVIGQESITNSSGADWTGYRMILSSGSSGGTPNFAFNTSSFPGPDFKIDPFSTFTFVSTNTELDLAGGTVKNGGVWTPGSTTGTGLALVTNSQTSGHFTLKELPISTSSPGPVIPVPTAAWTGLTTMLGLGLISAGKRAYHRLF